MPFPDDVIPSSQALENQARSPTKLQTDQASTEQTDHQSEVQLKSQPDIKSAQCELFPLNDYYRVVVDFWNWDPEKDGEPEMFDKALQSKCGKDNFDHFWWRRYPASKGTFDTRFMFNVPYPAKDRMKGDMYQLISDAIYEYTGEKIRTPCYMF